jgi:hypothetical protein
MPLLYGNGEAFAVVKETRSAEARPMDAHRDARTCS